jgi:translation initiation factor 2 subunit 1
MAAGTEPVSVLAKQEGRFYEADFPEVEDTVVVQVLRIRDIGADVALLEYNGVEGILLMSELSRRRIRSIVKLLKVGRTEICSVMRADRERGFIDLSKRRVDADDRAKKEVDYAKAKAVHSIMRHVAEKCNCDLEDFCSKFSWPLYGSKFGTPYDAYYKHINGDLNVWEHVSFTEPGEDLSSKEAEIKEVLEEDLKQKLLTQMLRIQAKIDVSCTEYEGINAIKEALLKGAEASKDGVNVSIKLISHPTFVLSLMCREKPFGRDLLEDAMQRIEKAIKDAGGEYKLVQPPTVVGGDQKEEGEGDEDGSASEASAEGSESSGKESMEGLDEEQLAELERMKDKA